MGERAPKPNQEHLKSFEELAETSEHLLAEHAETNEKEALKHNEQLAQDLRNEAHKDIAEATQSEKQVNPIEELQAEENATAPVEIYREPTQVVVQRQLNQIQRHLSRPQRRLSRLIHQPVVSKVSETAGKTVSRPSGMLGGGIVAFLGSSSYLYLAYHQGFKYNYGIFLALFFGGFLVGIALELIVWTVTRAKRSTPAHS